MEEARELFRDSLAILRQVGHETYQGITLGFAAKMERCAGETAAAEHLLDQAEPILHRVSDAINLAICLCERRQLALLQGRPAQELLEQAQQASTKLGTAPTSDLARAIASLRQAMKETGQLPSGEGS